PKGGQGIPPPNPIVCRLGPIPFTLAFQLANRERLTRGNAIRPCHFFGKMNGIALNSHFFGNDP
ncbi:MAG: hypothetical protein ACOC98_17900, partial [Thermodesulfobacteriota bacterium]